MKQKSKRAVAAAALAALAVAAVDAIAALAGHRTSTPGLEQNDFRHQAYKDCTRVNGRFGYYGNPWCSAAEQAAFDRREIRRLRQR